MNSNDILKIGIGAMLAVIGFFICKYLGRIETSEKSVNAVREDLGLIKASDKKQWTLLDEQKILNQELRERVLVLEVRNGQRRDEEKTRTG